MDEGSVGKYSYTVTGDPEVVRDFNRANIRREWKFWLKYAARAGASCVVAAGAAILTLRFFEREIDLGAGFIVALAVAFVVGALNIYSYAERTIYADAKSHEGETWTCEMDDDHWTISDKNGTRTSIPWGIMSLKFDYPDCWLVKYGNQSIVVNRKPLRDAGLEEEFKRRAKLGEEKAPTTEGEGADA